MFCIGMLSTEFSCRSYILGNIFIVSRYIGAREMGDPSSRKSYLPPDKQFLITRNGMNTILMMHPYTSASISCIWDMNVIMP
jgi:hypothetical protein